MTMYVDVLVQDASGFLHLWCMKVMLMVQALSSLGRDLGLHCTCLMDDVMPTSYFQ